MRKFFKRHIGQILLDAGFFTRQTLNSALQEQKQTKELLGQILVRMGVIKAPDFKISLLVQEYLSHIDDAVKTAAGERQLLGELLVQSGQISNEQLNDAIAEQTKSGEKLGEVFVRLGFMSDLQLNALLGLQQNQGRKSSNPLRLGELLVTTGHISRKHLKDALLKQSLSQKKLGEVLVQEGYARQSQIEYGMGLQKMLMHSVLAVIFSVSVNSTSMAADVQLEWDPSPDASVAGYKVYYQADSPAQPFQGTDSAEGAAPVDVQNQATATITGLDPEHTYYFAVTAYNSSGVESVYSNVVTIEPAPVPPPPDLTPPSLSLTSPVNSAVVSGTAVVSATASDDVGLSRVEFYNDGALIFAGNAAPFNLNWDTRLVANGSHTLLARVYDLAGNLAESTISVTVNNVVPDTVAPAVSSFSMPSSATSLTVAISSFAATDNVGVTGYLVTESATAPLASAAGWSATAPSSFTFSTEGARTAYAWSKDAAGNVSAALSRSVTITLPDIAAPVVTSFTLPGSASSLTVAISSFTASDEVGVVSYLVTESATAPLASASGWSAAPPSSFTFSGEGVRTAYAWTKDAAGNVSAGLSRSVTITLPDIVAPVVSSFSIPATANSLTVAISSFAASDKIGVTGYLVTESASAPAANASGWSSAPPSSFTFSGEGVRIAYAWTKDTAGNVSAGISRSVTITLPDIAAPVVTSFTLPESASSLTVAISSFTASDKFGVVGYLVTESASAPASNASGWSAAPPSSFTFSGEGGRIAYAWTKDAAGNVSAGLSRSVTITLPDIVAPIVSSFSIPATANSLTVAISSFAASDKVGVTGYLVTESASAPAANASGWSSAPPSSFTFSGEGVRIAYAWTKDAAGNVSAGLSRSVTITLPDIAAPVVTSFTLPESAYSLTVAISSFTASDKFGVVGYLVTESASAPAANASGWSAIAPSSFTFSAEGVRTAYAWTKDAAGNVSASLSRSVSITLPDIAAPVVTSFTLPESASSLTVAISSFTASDKVGVVGYLVTESASAPSANAIGWSASVPSSFTFSGEGVRTAYAWTKDAAGNVSAGLSRSVTITLPDTAAPTVSLDWFDNGKSVTVAVNANDDVAVSKVEFYLNGVLQATSNTAPYLFNLDTASMADGAYTLSSKAYDAAGNVGQSSLVTVNVSKPIVDTIAPTVAFLEPASTYIIGSNVSISSSATDNIAVTKVELYIDGSLKLSTTNSSFKIGWNFSLGVHKITVKAYDAANNVVTRSKTVNRFR